MKDREQIWKAKRANRKTMLFLMTLFAVGTLFAAYQYIISGTPVDDPSEPAYSEVVSIDARAASGQTLTTALETRCLTSASGVCSGVVDLSGPGVVFIIR